MATKKLSNGTTVSYNKNTGTFNVNGKTYSNKSDAASAINSAKGTSSGSSTKNRTNNSFVDVSVLQDQHMGMSNQDIANKWGGTNADGTPNKAGQSKVLQALNKNNRVYGTGGYTKYDANTGLYSKPSSSSSSSSANDTIGQYGDASYKNYTNAFNKFKSQGADDETARKQAAGMLENEDLLNPKTDEQLAAEASSNDDFDYEGFVDDIMNQGEGEEGEPDTPPMDEQIAPEWRETEEGRNKYISDAIDSALEPYLDRLEQSNVVKETVPEERDTSYDYNTYWQENLAPNTTYEGGESQNTHANETGLTFTEKYQEPVTQSLEDLGLLTPNEEAATNDGVEEQVTPGLYNNPEEIVSGFEGVLENLGQGGQEVNPKDVAQAYVDYRKQLKNFVDNNRMSVEDYKNYLKQMRNNQLLKSYLTRK